MQAFFLNFTLDGCQKPFNFNKLEGKKKTLKFISRRLALWIILILSPLQDGMTLNALEKCLFPFMALYRVQNHDKYKFFAFRCVIS